MCRLPASSFRAKARNLFRSRSVKRGEDDGSREAPHSLRRGITVLHADSLTKENGNGKQKRSLDCARDDNTRAGLFPIFSSHLGSQPPPLRGTAFRGKEGVCRLLASSFRAKARNLFRSRSGKRDEDDGSREAPHSLRRGITVLHANSFTKENGNGKRKRSLDCARDDNTGEGCLTFPFIPRRE